MSLTFDKSIGLNLIFSEGFSHFPSLISETLRILRYIILLLKAKMKARLWVVTIILLACSCAVVSKKCKITYKKNRRCVAEEYLTRSGGSTSMNIKRCAKFCKEKSGCRSFSLFFYTQGPPWQETLLGDCSLYRDKNPRKKKSKGNFCGKLKCWDWDCLRIVSNHSLKAIACVASANRAIICSNNRTRPSSIHTVINIFDKLFFWPYYYV